MNVNLDKCDLISLVKGQDPSYKMMEHPLVKANGRYAGSYGRWDWNYKALEKNTEQEIWELYQLLKTN